MILTATNPEATGPMTWHLLIAALVSIPIGVTGIVALGVICEAFRRRARRQATTPPVRVDQSNVRLLPGSSPRRIDTSRRPAIPRRLEGPR